MKSPILIILKPEIFDPEIRNTNPDVFLPGGVFPSPDILLADLFR
jgi:hypothetical protein